MLLFVHKSIRFIKLSSGLLLGVALLFPLRLMGAEQPDQPVLQPERLLELLDVVDAPREYLSEKFVSFAGDVDRFFGGERNYQESNQSVFQLDVTRISGYGGDNSLEFSGRAKLHLPGTEKKLHLLLETDPEQNVAGETAQRKTVVNKRTAESNRVSVGARYEKKKEMEKKGLWHFSTDAGIKVRAPLEPFARARLSYSVREGEWLKKTTGTVFWFNSIGAGQSTQYDKERFLSEPVLFRASSSATWLHDKQNFDLGQSAAIFHTLNDRNAVLYQASVSGATHPQWQVNEYVLLLLYRYRLHRDWMFFELSPQIHFPKDRDFQASPLVSMRLEILFENK